MKGALAVAAILGLCSAGCTSSNPASASPFAVQVSGTVAPGSAFQTRQDIIAPHDGTLTVTLTWPNSANGLKLGLTSKTCTDLFDGSSGCTLKALTETGPGESVTSAVTAGSSQLTAWVRLYSGSSTPYTLRIEVK
jgi:hypothetical protein